MRLPDFIIAGAPRSGTTWLYRLLDRHPDIYMAKPLAPEPKFFLVDDLYRRGLEHYSRTWFAGIESRRRCGEKSTNYLENPAAAERIARHLPEVKLIFILREPTSRAFSNYLWSRMNGLEDQDFAAALELEATRELNVPERLRYARPHAYFSRGLYAKMLTPWIERFPRENLFVVRYEEIIHRPRLLARRLHLFLEVPSRPGDCLDLGEVNPSEKAGIEMPEAVRRRLRKAYRRPNQDLARLLELDFDIWETRR